MRIYPENKTLKVENFVKNLTKYLVYKIWDLCNLHIYTALYKNKVTLRVKFLIMYSKLVLCKMSFTTLSRSKCSKD